ncbi:ribonucleoside-diphosphate reductase large subunit isoform X1 [Vitis vinifera]|uniref:ribonucleoside-diphosphate reductase large subunit isoform X1 n=1 Tax=Vitis vinifera TaxID=29760 RepID=UPI00053FF520|nr:ribonucleoside-diphosphate reductase large subunit isoform X1 [Vitis vinifera]|eukprot:XP_010652892.1 PREDICTED: ribonucleoside-diphosphate reductase large subunit-like isoform X1 [Vitis vinifera]
MAEVYEHVTTSHLDELATAMTANHPNCASVRFFFFPDYVSFFFFLAERIVVSNLHKNTKKSFSETIKDMHNHFNERSGLKNPWIAADVYKIIMKVTAIVLSNLNKIIDINYYSVETAKRSNLCHRPFGIGVQGLADTFILHGMA